MNIRMGFALFLLLGLSLLAPAGGWASPGPGAPAAKAQGNVSREPVARWGGVTITSGQFLEYAISKAGMSLRHGGAIPPDKMRALLDEMIGKRILEEAASAREIREDPATRASLRIVAARLSADRYLREHSRQFEVGDGELAAALPKSRRVALIRLLTTHAEEEAKEAEKRIRKGMTFDEAVGKYSESKIAGGGEVLELREDDDLLGREAAGQVLSLEAGRMSGVLRLPIGYGLALVVKRREFTDDEWKRMAETRREQIFQKKVARAYEDLVAGKVRIDEHELAAASQEDFEFERSHRPVLSAEGETVFFDDYLRTRPVHLRDTMKIRTPEDLLRAYKLELENLGAALVLASKAASEKGAGGEPGEREVAEISLRVLGEKIFQGIRVREDEVRKEYDRNRKQFTSRKRYKVKRVTFPSRKEAEEFRRRVKTAEDFYRALRSGETRDDRYFNTFEEWQYVESLDPKIARALDRAGAGKLTGVVAVSDTVQHVYLVETVEKKHLFPYEEVRSKIKRWILRTKQEKELSGFVEREKKKHKLVVLEPALERVRQTLNRKEDHRGSVHPGKPQEEKR